MKKASLRIFLLTLITATLACGSTAPTPSVTLQSTLEFASDNNTHEVTPVPEQPVSPTESLPTEGGIVTEPGVSVAGIRVVYIREGNLWSWTEAGGTLQLTDTGDMSTARVSDDAQLLAFMRGSEVWTIGMDGTDVRLLVTQPETGGKLWFAPNAALLAITASDHISIVDLNTGNETIVVTYPTIPDGFFPDIVWMSDSSGFKTIIPAPTEGGQAEMLYVFPDGTVASLAKFAMVSSPDFPYYFSTDGGYVIYTAKLDDGRESLYLMGSSGATRPYGEPAASVRAYGWFPNSNSFAFGWKGASRLFLGEVDSLPVEIALTLPGNVRWVDDSHYLAIRSGELIWGDVNELIIVIDSSVTDFDFLPLN